MLKDLYKSALKNMIETGEIDKVINHTKKNESKMVTSYRDELKAYLAEGNKIEDFPILPLIIANNSAELWKDIFVVMAGLEGKENDEK